MATSTALQEVEDFRRDGYVVVRRLFDAEEVGRLLNWARSDPTLAGQSLRRADGEGGVTRLRVWNWEGDDLYGLVARSRRIVDRMEAFLGGEVYFYHSKLTLKEPRTGGAWAWHQDYGYWYNNGCLYPDMASCLIALDPADRENGCLQVLKGSHLCGRIDHGKVGDQTGADRERVARLAERLPLAYCEMSPGDGVFFHANLLHRSDQNRSDRPRWSFICCYNTRRNDPVVAHHHPNYHPLAKLDDDQFARLAEAATGSSVRASE